MSERPTAEELYLFDLHGYLVVEGALDADEVARLDAAVDRITADAPADAPTVQAGAGGGELIRRDPAFAALVAHRRITPYLEALLDPDVRLDHEYLHVIRPGAGPTGMSSALLHGGGTPYDASQWYAFRDGRPVGGLLVVAYALRDVRPGDGGLAVVPGSHKANLPFPAGWADLDAGTPPCAVAVPVRAGDAVLFTEALTHGTLPWRGSGERRTLFYKYCPHPLAWSWRYPDGSGIEGLDERARALLEAPNGRSPNRLRDAP